MHIHKHTQFVGRISIIARDGHTEAKILNIMSEANMSLCGLCATLWNNHNVSIRVKGNSSERSYCPPYFRG